MTYMHHYPSAPLIQSLPQGPIDIIGDIHGEYHALCNLLNHLGVTGHESLDQEIKVERPLVFVGDLIDRGPNSPKVVDVVSRLVREGVAQCIMGNHELNLIRDLQKEGNGWFIRRDQPDTFLVRGTQQRIEFPSEIVTDFTKRRQIKDFLSSLPLALEREDLRVVHACWCTESIEAVRGALDVLKVRQTFSERYKPSKELRMKRKEELKEHGNLKDDYPQPTTLLRHHIEYEELTNRNPVTRLTCGIERGITSAQAAEAKGGKWRQLVRIFWPDEYRETVPVICGHYWRRKESILGDWKSQSPFHWSGALNNVFCVDYSVGKRFQERAMGVNTNFNGSLAALRWPERTLIFDHDPSPVPTRGYKESD